MAEYKDTPRDFIRPTLAEIRARKRRNIAIALALVGFVAFVFMTVATRLGNPPL